MKLLNNLFRSSRKGEVAQTSVIESEQSFIARDKFVDDTPPVFEDEKVKNQIEIFLGQDYGSVGFQDGYKYHNVESLDANTSQIKSQFLKLIKKAIDGKMQEIFSLNDEIIQVEGISPKISDRLKLRIKEVERIVKKLEYEIELCTLETGLVMCAINSYKDGFMKGIGAYHELKYFAKEVSQFNF